MKRIAIFASGSGSNAENIINYFEKVEKVEVCLIISNKSDAFVFQRAKRLGIPFLHITKKQFYKSDDVISILKSLSVDLIVLAGFLWLVPSSLIESFPKRIVNVHPALLPKYGGKGMYGNHVHTAVKENRETETGITIHYVNDAYDEEAIIFQTKVGLSSDDQVEDIVTKIHKLEFEYFPNVIHGVLKKL